MNHDANVASTTCISAGVIEKELIGQRAPVRRKEMLIYKNQKNSLEELYAILGPSLLRVDGNDAGEGATIRCHRQSADEIPTKQSKIASGNGLVNADVHEKHFYEIGRGYVGDETARPRRTFQYRYR